jgi:alpha-beta hydrolase superfamily lysophospholipase
VRPLTLRLHDRTRGRALETVVRLPDTAAGPAPLIVFGHGFYGHPRKFGKLLGAWADAGFVVAAPAFPLTNDTVEKPVFDDVVNQPRDVRFVVDELLRTDEVGPRVDPERLAVAGFSLGAVTALAVGFNSDHRDARVRAVVSLAGCFWPELGGSYEMTATALLVVHGTADGVVSYASGEEIYRVARSPKALVTLEDGLHEQLFEDEAGPDAGAVDTTTAFWRLFLNGDAGARAALSSRSGVRVEAEL